MSASSEYNVLTLDGGGVRGLSSLIILKRLMSLINVAVHSATGLDVSLTPKDVFDLVVGTSTGGLIALLLVKLGYDIDGCIEKYQVLSKEIFSHPHFLGKLTAGLGRWAKYSGSHLRRVVEAEAMAKAPTSRHSRYRLQDIDDHQEFRCAVVCNELRSSDLHRLTDPIFLCSHRDMLGRPDAGQHACSLDSKDITVIEAARATSAAPTYFNHITLMGRMLVDGGFGETNNPSFAAWSHYFATTGDNVTDVRMVNIGTGTEPRGFQASPKWILRRLRALIKNLGDIATQSENTGRLMEILASQGTNLCFDRFSANCDGLHTIELFAYKRNKEIELATYRYLEIPEVGVRLRKVAKELADQYLKCLQTGRRAAPAGLEILPGTVSVLDSRPMPPNVPEGITAELPEHLPQANAVQEAAAPVHGQREQTSDANGTQSKSVQAGGGIRDPNSSQVREHPTFFPDDAYAEELATRQKIPKAAGSAEVGSNSVSRPVFLESTARGSSSLGSQPDTYTSVHDFGAPISSAPPAQPASPDHAEHFDSYPWQANGTVTPRPPESDAPESTGRPSLVDIPVKVEQPEHRLLFRAMVNGQEPGHASVHLAEPGRRRTS